MPGRILVVEDSADLLAFYAESLRRADYEVMTAPSGRIAERIVRTSPVDVVVTDLKMPGIGGLDVLRIAKEVDPQTIVIVITGYPAVDTAVQVMKCGAADYVVKPFPPGQLVEKVASVLAARAVKEEYALLKTQLRSTFTLEGMVGHSRPMLRLLDDVRSAASADANVLILGESGVGKERVAETIHANSSRRDGPFVPINCAAIPEALLEAELFGYERGAFTGAHTAKDGLLESADGGTVFLDELSEMHLQLQAKLLRAVEEGGARRLGGRKLVRFDVRFLAAMNRNVHDELRRGRLREDLFFRIDVIEIRVPPLRERREDIPLLAAFFLEASNERAASKIEGIAPEALELLMRYDWPGNVRELKNAIERAVAYAERPIIGPDELPAWVAKAAADQPAPGFRAWKDKVLEHGQGELVAKALEEHDGNISRAAKALGVHRSTFQRFMRRYDLRATPTSARTLP